MKYISTRKGIAATSAETVFQGLAPDGGLYVPATVEKVAGIERAGTLRAAEELVMGALFDDLPADVRTAAADRLCARFPAEDPIPLVEKDGLHILELFHGKTGAFKDVALSMLPVFMKHAAAGSPRAAASGWLPPHSSRIIRASRARRSSCSIRRRAPRRSSASR